MNIEIKNFFELGSKLLSSTFQAHPLNLSYKQNIKGFDDVLKLAIGEYENISLPVVFEHAYGKKLEDLLDTGSACLYLISDNMKSVLEENGLTGWKTFSVKVLDKKGLEIKGYHGLSVTGRCGPIDYSKSDIIEKSLVPGGPLGRFYKGLNVGLDKWDGSDFFLPEKNFGPVVTNRAAEILKKSGLTNISLQRLNKIEILQ